MCRTGFMGVVNRYCTHYVLYKSDFSMCHHYCLQTFIEIWTIFTPHLLFFPSHLLLILKLFSHQDYYSIALFINFVTFFPSHLLFHRISYSIAESTHLHDACWCWRWGILQSTGVKVQIDSFGSINMMYACISVLRALALKSGPSQVWKDYTKFDSHLEERMKTEIYTKVQKIKNSDTYMNMKM